MRKKKVQ